MRSQRISVLLTKRFRTPNWVKVSFGNYIHERRIYFILATTLFIIIVVVVIIQFSLFSFIMFHTAQGAQRGSHVCRFIPSRG